LEGVLSASARKPKVVLTGAAGRMGVTISGRFLTDGKIELVGACDVAGVGNPAGDEGSPLIVRSVKDLPADLEADLVLDFSNPEGTRENLALIMERGWDLLIGATGHTVEDIENLTKAAEKYSRRIVLVPNFTPGVNLMFKFAKMASRVFKDVEIIEMHHEKKLDAPSGTALHTAKLIGDEKNIPIHSVRLPGLLAHQEVIFGSEGEVLTIRQDTIDRGAFLSGIYLAIEKMEDLEAGFVMGMDWAFGE